ncbi:MAG: DUF3137 domain-containing protein [Clostridia bacterium]|jgi:uncharacterized Tic20 family protein|nr:DUF3137 domain-containing protein [Clostridia bacterium]
MLDRVNEIRERVIKRTKGMLGYNIFVGLLILLTIIFAKSSENNMFVPLILFSPLYLGTYIMLKNAINTRNREVDTGIKKLLLENEYDCNSIEVQKSETDINDILSFFVNNKFENFIKDTIENFINDKFNRTIKNETKSYKYNDQNGKEVEVHNVKVLTSIFGMSDFGVVSLIFVLWLIGGSILNLDLESMILIAIVIGAFSISMFMIRSMPFNGLIIKMKMNKSINGELYLYPDNLKQNLKLVLRDKEAKITKLEDIRFEKDFIVATSDDLDARYILTTKLMEELTEYKHKLKKDIYIIVKNDNIKIAIDLKGYLIKKKLKEEITKEDVDEALYTIGIIKSIDREINI